MLANPGRREKRLPGRRELGLAIWHMPLLVERDRQIQRLAQRPWLGRIRRRWISHAGNARHNRARELRSSFSAAGVVAGRKCAGRAISTARNASHCLHKKNGAAPGGSRPKGLTEVGYLSAKPVMW